MNTSTSLRTALAAAVAAAGLTVGGIGLASAADNEPEPNTSSTPSRPDHGPGHHGGGPDGTALADALGVTEDELTAALESLRDQLSRPEFDRGSPPSETEMDERRAAFAAALAEALGLEEADVTAALEELHDEREAGARTALSDRLDEAVDAGDLTAADKASVLKAFDADVLSPFGHGRP